MIFVMTIYHFQRIFLSNKVLVDFSKTDDVGRSIFGSLLTQETFVRKCHRSLQSLTSIEKTFFYLISKAREKLTEEEINRIIESPDHSGWTIFSSASTLSKNISEWILKRNIEVATVDNKWMTPQFIFESNFEIMLKKGINPFVVAYDGKSEFDLRNFENIDQTLLQPFITEDGKIIDGKTEAFYSFKDSKCNDECPKLCDDNMKKFKLYSREKKFRIEKRGGEGVVSMKEWHTKPAAFKLLKIGKIEITVRRTLADAILNAKKTQAEFETISKLSHPNILKVLHVFRYQETEKIGNKRSLENWTIIVMEKHEKNIGELALYQRIYLPYLVQDTLGTVFNKILNLTYTV